MAKKIWNVVVIGCGAMAKLHMKGIKATEGANLYGICDTHAERLETAKRELECELAIDNWKQFVEDPAVDAAVIVTPDQMHLEMTSAFLRAGKAVLCEKPMALTLEECEEMRRVEKETNGKLMIGQICRCTPSFALVKKMIDEGRLGELMFVESEYAHNYTLARGIGDWRVDPKRHAVIGGGCHPIDLLRWIAGNPTEVYAYGNHKSLLDWPTDDTTIAIMKFPNDVIGKVFVSTGCKRNYTMRSVFYGTKGTIICDNSNREIQLFENNDELGKKYHEDPQLIPVVVNNHNATEEIRNFMDALLNDKPMPVSSFEGAATVAVCCAAVESIAAGKPIQIKYPEEF
ncbi:MAG: Gfo/Idh/MocA family oxidoreductase [Clostridia bacterium]|nr:Gfo/Idh/MocA family oxidoreductase [Clostridia bacterium]